MPNQNESKQDITMHSDEELSLIVFNTEPLYRLRRRRPAILRDILSEMFIFTTDQFNVLIQDIEADLNEEAA